MRREAEAVKTAAKKANRGYGFNYSNLAAFKTWIKSRGNKKFEDNIYWGFHDLRQAGFQISCDWFYDRKKKCSCVQTQVGSIASRTKFFDFERW